MLVGLLTACSGAPGGQAEASQSQIDEILQARRPEGGPGHLRALGLQGQGRQPGRLRGRRGHQAGRGYGRRGRVRAHRVVGHHPRAAHRQVRRHHRRHGRHHRARAEGQLLGPLRVERHRRRGQQDDAAGRDQPRRSEQRGHRHRRAAGRDARRGGRNSSRPRPSCTSSTPTRP